MRFIVSSNKVFVCPILLSTSRAASASWERPGNVSWERRTLVRYALVLIFQLYASWERQTSVWHVFYVYIPPPCPLCPPCETFFFLSLCPLCPPFETFFSLPPCPLCSLCETFFFPFSVPSVSSLRNLLFACFRVLEKQRAYQTRRPQKVRHAFEEEQTRPSPKGYPTYDPNTAHSPGRALSRAEGLR